MAGIKLQKEAGKSTGNPKITDYIAGKHYKEGMGQEASWNFSNMQKRELLKTEVHLITSTI